MWLRIGWPNDAVAAPPLPAARDAYDGAAFEPPADAGQHFRETMSIIREGPFCGDDQDRVKLACSYLSTAMHDGSSSFIAATFTVSGECDSSRKFVLRDNLPVTVGDLQNRARALRAMDSVGACFVEGILKPIARYCHFVLKQELPVSRDRAGLSSEIKAIEYILSRRILPTPGVLMPPSRHWSANDQCLFFGLFFSTCPSAQLITACQELVIEIGKAHHKISSDSFWDRATHEYKYAKLEAPSTPSPKRHRTGGDGRTQGPKKTKVDKNSPSSPYVRFTKEERQAHGAAIKAQREASLTLSPAPSTPSGGGSSGSSSMSGASSSPAGPAAGAGQQSAVGPLVLWRPHQQGGRGGRGGGGTIPP